MMEVPPNHCAILRALVESGDRRLLSDYLSRLPPGTPAFAAYTADWTPAMLDFLLECEKDFSALRWRLGD